MQSKHFSRKVWKNRIADLMKGTNSQIEAYTSEISNEENSAQDLLAKVNAQEAEIDKLIKQQKDEEAAAELAKQKAAAQAKAAEEAKKQAAEAERAAQAKAAEAQQSASQSSASSSTQQTTESSASTNTNTTVTETPSQEETVEDTSSSTTEDTNDSSSSSGDSSSSSQGTYLGKFTITGYCNCSQCGGQGLTASGTVPTAGRTVAMNGIPFGTKLLINGVVYTVEDRGVPYGHVDVYYDTHSQALGNGRYYADVYQLN